MLLTLLVVAVAASLLIGAAWGYFLPLPERVKGNLLAFGGGALLSSLVLELFMPAMDTAGAGPASLALLAGAAGFAIVDHWVDEIWGGQSGLSLLAAISLDGIPENLALGVDLIGAGAREVSAFAAAIMLSNLPEAAAGARNMRERGWSGRRVALIWGIAALILSGVTIGGNLLLQEAGDGPLGLIRAVAAGAVVASLVTELFPQAHRDGDDLTGVASACGVICAAVLSRAAV
ncbi:MAG: zinc transporter [Roseovarius sp.]|uniref:ZIP family metal transporter n=1 Tax=Roseovarius sp. TaxID=1486281 RepID=UPI0032EA9C43